MEITKFDLAAMQAGFGFIAFILFAIPPMNPPAMILSLALFVTAMDLANTVAQ